MSSNKNRKRGIAKREHRVVSVSADGERRIPVFPRLERVAPQDALPHVRIAWAERELERLAELASADAAAPPTDKLIHAMRD